MAQAPALVRASNPLTRRPPPDRPADGPELLVSRPRPHLRRIPRTAPVAIPEIDGRRYVLGAYGEGQSWSARTSGPPARPTSSSTAAPSTSGQSGSAAPRRSTSSRRRCQAASPRLPRVGRLFAVGPLPARGPRGPQRPRPCRRHPPGLRASRGVNVVDRPDEGDLDDNEDSSSALEATAESRLRYARRRQCARRRGRRRSGPCPGRAPRRSRRSAASASSSSQRPLITSVEVGRSRAVSMRATSRSPHRIGSE